MSIGGGHHNTVIGNDIYDVGAHIKTTGNGADIKGDRAFELTNNLVANNHMTQVYLRGKWMPAVGAMGDRFSHTLLHISPSQLIQTGTPLMMFERWLQTTACWMAFSSGAENASVECCSTSVCSSIAETWSSVKGSTPPLSSAYLNPCCVNVGAHSTAAPSPLQM